MHLRTSLARTTQGGFAKMVMLVSSYILIMVVRRRRQQIYISLPICVIVKGGESTNGGGVQRLVRFFLDVFVRFFVQFLCDFPRSFLHFIIDMCNFF